MWADTLLRAEQQHLLRLFFWAALSIVAATGVAATLAVRRARSPLLSQFAGQMAIWGLVIGLIAGIEWHRAALRDLSGAARLERMVWMTIGLDVGFVVAGCALAGCAWFLARRMAVVGAGVGVVIQGLALLLIDLQFAAVISR